MATHVDTNRILKPDPNHTLVFYLLDNNARDVDKSYKEFSQGVKNVNIGHNKIKIFGSTLDGNKVSIRLSSEVDNTNLKKMLLDNRLLSIANFNQQPPLATRERREDRYLVVGIDPSITKISKTSSSKDNIFKIIRDHYCSIDPSNSLVITSRDVSVVECRFKYAAIICYTKQSSDLISSDPNIFYGLDHWQIYRYPFIPTCTICCSMTHLAENCPTPNEPICSKCAENHLTEFCDPSIPGFEYKCIYCSTSDDLNLREFSRHGARSTFCGSRINAVILMNRSMSGEI